MEQNILNAIIFLGSVLGISIISAIFRICYLVSQQLKTQKESLRIQELEFDINYKKIDDGSVSES